ncbi:MAG: hypothetical protein V7K21_07040 [Nostoc sp.]|uniref:hypothetical protein n=1 Tax=Nostoc sp. TaxID=1180 RepID=UPI002FFBB369
MCWSFFGSWSQAIAPDFSSYNCEYSGDRVANQSEQFILPSYVRTNASIFYKMPYSAFSRLFMNSTPRCERRH